MNRKTFLSVAACIALAVGCFALLMPAALLASKGIGPNAAAEVWVREVGIALLALGTMAGLMRDQADSPAMRAFLIGNAVLQLGLFPIEILACADGVVTKAAGIVPNSLLHLLLAGGFVVFALRVRMPAKS